MNQKTTRDNYFGIWRNFNKFLIRLDRRPKSWEDRTAAYIGYLVKHGYQSATVRSYTSAIKASLRLIDYEWNEKKMLISTLTKACRTHNDKLKSRLPIGKNLLKILLSEIEHALPTQYYLALLYRTIFLVAYYGLLRISEICGIHAIKAPNVHINDAKDKLLFILYSSKTHGKESKPQLIKIKKSPYCKELAKACPVEVTKSYLELRGSYSSDSDHLFVFSDKSPVLPRHLRAMLKLTLRRIGLDPSMYDTHSFRSGRASDLADTNTDIETIKKVWQMEIQCSLQISNIDFIFQMLPWAPNHFGSSVTNLRETATMIAWPQWMKNIRM